MTSRRFLEGVAHHEAGHAVAAWSLGVEIKRISIVPDTESNARCVHRAHLPRVKLSSAASPQAQRMLENLTISCLAGPLAMKRFDPRSRRIAFGGEDDFQRAVALVMNLTSDRETLQAWIDLLSIRARKLVESHWPKITRLAAALTERHQLSQHEVERILGRRRVRRA